MSSKRPQSFLGTPATAPGPLGPNMLRDFALIRTNPLEYLFQTWREYGDVVQFPIPKPPTYLVNSPSGVRHVLVNNGRNYGKSTIQYKALSLVTGEGLLTADTSQWQRTRPIIQPAFHQALLDGLGPITASVADQLASEWKGMPSSAVVDVDQFMLSAALDVVSQFLFGAQLSGNAHVITEATLSALDVVIARARVPITPPGWIPTPANRKLNQSVRTLDNSVRQLLQQRRSAVESQFVDAQFPEAQSADTATHMIDLLVSATDAQGRALTPREIRDEIVTFIVAGHETVASALSWSWALLAANPELQENLAQEAVNAGHDVEAGIENLPHIRSFYEEVLRLYPPAWLITRKALADDVIDGISIPANSLIILSPALLHRHPAVWEQPDDFQPDRFLHKYPRESFIPFGAGLRQCIGKDFSYIEGVQLLAALLSKFSVRYPQEISIPEGEPLVTIRPRGGVRLVLNPRE